jgi:hypothetical protein
LKTITAVLIEIRHIFGVIRDRYTEDPIEFFGKLAHSYPGL